MRCDEAKDLLDLHMDDELPLELAAKLDRHLLRCAPCAGEVRALEQARALLRSAVPRAEASPAFRERTAARLHDVLAQYLRPAPAEDDARQWILPFPKSDAKDSF